MKYLDVLGFVILFSACKIGPQPREGVITISSINVYKDFWEGGYTTVGAFTHFDYMDKDGVGTIAAPDEDIKKIEQMLNSSELYKHYQTKIGGGVVFCKIVFKGRDHSVSRVLIRCGIEASVITDLTHRKDYVIKDPAGLKWLSDFKERMKNQ